MHLSISPPASKSESNRALIIEALAHYQARHLSYTTQIQNLSTARDTQTLQTLLRSPASELNVLDAGTTMRFLTAYFAITQQAKVLCGTERMHERPIGVLVDALRSIGFNIQYLQNEGYPPLQIYAPAQGHTWQQRHTEVYLRADISSQYISALLMIAPLLPQGLTIHLLGDISSQPYITMTIAQMRHYGVEVKQQGANLAVTPQQYAIMPYSIETDWSGASYWYSLWALLAHKKGLKNTTLLLRGLKPNSLQGDSIIQSLMQPLGINTRFTQEGAELSISPILAMPEIGQLDFQHCPDLAQTIIVCSALLGINISITGLESLRIKETDRLQALQTELAKIKVYLTEDSSTNCWKLYTKNIQIPSKLFINTYQDHRMAMAFSVLSIFCDLVVDNPQVVHKSYPHFWEDWHYLYTCLASFQFFR